MIQNSPFPTMNLNLAPRPRELHDGLNRDLYHPLARKLARALAPTFVTPNMVSIAGAMLVVAAAFVYVSPGWPLTAVFGLMLHMAWHVFDGADGDLARMTGRSSVHGELIDGICDYCSHIFLYLMLGAVMAADIGAIGWVVLVIAGASHIIQVNHYEVQRRQYQYWVYGVPWMQTSNAGIAPRSGMRAILTGYLALASQLASRESVIDDAVRSASDERRLAQSRAIIRKSFAKPLRAATLLGANHRTITLGISMLAGTPLFHMVYQIVILNLIMVWSMSVQRRAVAQTIIALRPDRQAPVDTH
jgi:phosphatidylglycerophosphate synthase